MAIIKKFRIKSFKNNKEVVKLENISFSFGENVKWKLDFVMKTLDKPNEKRQIFYIFSKIIPVKSFCFSTVEF